MVYNFRIDFFLCPFHSGCVCVRVCVFYSEGACLLLWSLYAHTSVCLFLCPFSCWNPSDNFQVWHRDLKLFNFLSFPLGFLFCFVFYFLLEYS